MINVRIEIVVVIIDLVTGIKFKICIEFIIMSNVVNSCQMMFFFDCTINRPLWKIHGVDRNVCFIKHMHSTISPQSLIITRLYHTHS